MTVIHEWHRLGKRHSRREAAGPPPPERNGGRGLAWPGAPCHGWWGLKAGPYLSPARL